MTVDGAVSLIGAVEAIDEEVAEGCLRQAPAVVAGDRLAGRVGFVRRRDHCCRICRQHSVSVDARHPVERIKTLHLSS